MADMRRAFTMAELGIALATLGLFGVVAYPRFARSVDRASVRAAIHQTAEYLVEARAAAMERGHEARLVRTGDVISISVSDNIGAPSPLAPARDLYVEHRVHLGATHDTARFDSQGYAIGTGGHQVIRFTGRAYSDSLCVPASGLIDERGCAR